MCDKMAISAYILKIVEKDPFLMLQMKVKEMFNRHQFFSTDKQSCFSVQFLEQLLKFQVNFTLFKCVESQRSYGLLITKELIFDFQILDSKDHFSASLNTHTAIRLLNSDTIYTSRHSKHIMKKT